MPSIPTIKFCYCPPTTRACITSWEKSTPRLDVTKPPSTPTSRPSSFSPSYLKARYRLDMLLELMGRHKEAIKIFRSALKIPHKGNRVYLSLGWALNEEKRFYEAVDILNQSIERNPENPESHYALGWAYQGLRRVPLAVQSYEKTLLLNPNHTRALFKLNLIQTSGKIPCRFPPRPPLLCQSLYWKNDTAAIQYPNSASDKLTP